jgi:hypothetical protein
VNPRLVAHRLYLTLRAGTFAASACVALYWTACEIHDRAVAARGFACLDERLAALEATGAAVPRSEYRILAVDEAGALETDRTAAAALGCGIHPAGTYSLRAWREATSWRRRHLEEEDVELAWLAFGPPLLLVALTRWISWLVAPPR